MTRHRAPIGQDHAGTWRSVVTYQGRRWFVLADSPHGVVLRAEGEAPTAENTIRVPRAPLRSQLGPLKNRKVERGK